MKAETRSFYDLSLMIFYVIKLCWIIGLHRVIHKSVKHFKNSQQIDYATDHGNSYVARERNCLSFFFKEKPAHIVALICR